MRTYLQNLFDVRPEERFRVGWMMLYSLAAIGGVMIAGRVISRTLFLSMLPQSATPFKFILPPLFVMVVLALYVRATPRIPSSRLIIGSSLIMMAGVLGFRMLLETPLANQFGVVAALYVYFEVIATLVGVQFWTFASEIFTTREARRLFGVITVGGLLANSLSGGALQLAAYVVLPRDLLFVVVAALLGSTVCVWSVARRQGVRRPTRVEHAPPATSSWAGILSTPLLVTVGGIMIVTSLVSNILEYQLDLTLVRFFSSDTQGMLAFLGRFQFWLGMAALLVQVFITNQVMGRFGLIVSLLILPLVLMAGSTAVIVTGGMLWAVVMARGGNVALRYSINDVATNMLFLPVQIDLRRQAKALLDGILKPPVVGLLGLVFLLTLNPNIDLIGVQAADVTPWSYVVLALVVVWTLLAVRAHRQYATALAKTLQARRLELGSDLNLTDALAQRVLRQKLRDPDPASVVNALDLLAGTHAAELLPEVLPLLDHELSSVRIAAVHCLVGAEDPNAAEALRHLLDDDDDDVAGEALRGLCRLLGKAAIPILLPLAEHPSPTLRTTAIVGMIRYGTTQDAQHGVAQLQRLIADPDPAVRSATATALGELPLASADKPLVTLLEDKDLQVQRAAVEAAGTLLHLALLLPLIHKLNQPGVAQVAMRAIRKYGNAAESHLAALLGDSERSAAIRGRIATLLGDTPTTGAVAALVNQIDDPNPGLRDAVLAALVHLQTLGMTIGASPNVLRRGIQRELRGCYEILVMEADLRATDDDLLGTALQSRRAAILGRVVMLLRLLHPDHDLSQVQRVLVAGDEEIRANAVELLAVVAEGEIAELLIPLLDADSQRRLTVAVQTLGLSRRGVADRLTELVADPEPWLAVCSMHAIGQLRSPLLAPVVEEGLGNRDPLVREAALWAAVRLLSPDLVRRAAQRLQHDPHRVPRRYATYVLASVAPSSASDRESPE